MQKLTPQRRMTQITKPERRDVLVDTFLAVGMVTSGAMILAPRIIVLGYAAPVLAGFMLALGVAVFLRWVSRPE